MKPNDRPGTDLLGELVLGRRSTGDPEVLAAFAADPELERRWQELSRTARFLDAASDFEASLFREAREGESTPAADANVGRVLREEAQRPRSPWKPWALAIAAGLLLVAWLAFRGRGEPDPGSTYLGGASGAPLLLEPTGTLDSSAAPAFRWAFVPEPGWEGHCEVVLYDDAGSELLRSGEIREPIRGSTWEWRPTGPTAPSQWIDLARNEAFFWQVSTVSNLGAVTSSAPRQVFLAPSER